MAVRLYNQYSDIAADRARRIDREGSPNYNYSCGALAAGASVTVAVYNNWPLAQKYEPLDYLLIVNNDAVDVDVHINGQLNTFFTPAHTIREETPPAIWQFTITNLDAANAVTAGALRLTLKRRPLDADRKAAERG